MKLQSTKEKETPKLSIAKKYLPVILAVFTGAAFMWNAFTANVMEQFVRLHTFTDFACAFFRWVQLTGFAFIFPALLWKEQRCAFLCLVAVLPATVGALAFSGNFFAVHRVNGAEIAAYALMNATFLLSCALCAHTYLSERRNGEKTDGKSTLILFFCVLIGVIPLNLFMQIPVLMNAKFLKFVRFGGWHFLFVGIAVAAAFLTGLYLKKLPKEKRYVAVFILALVLFCHLALRFSFVRLRAYHSKQGILSALPLYVCSFGIFLLPFAVASRSSFFQGILFLINAPGAIVAFIWPACGPVTIFHYNVTYFVVSHILLFVTTAQLASALGGVPTVRHIKHLSYLIAVYYLLMFGLNALVQEFKGENLNFSYVSFSPLPLALHNFLAIRIGKSSLSLPYLLVLCAVQYALCFLTFGLWMLLRKLSSLLRRKKETVLASPVTSEIAAAEEYAAAEGYEEAGEKDTNASKNGHLPSEEEYPTKSETDTFFRESTDKKD